mmetsp:Transcript_43862/g.113272  ORF Transcript_43862/g.113272 Transcript_43862/m.113272 type:complete len:376 (+) Transcript_43862:522-1649(+)
MHAVLVAPRLAQEAAQEVRLRQEVPRQREEVGGAREQQGQRGAPGRHLDQRPPEEAGGEEVGGRYADRHVPFPDGARDHLLQVPAPLAHVALQDLHVDPGLELRRRRDGLAEDLRARLVQRVAEDLREVDDARAFQHRVHLVEAARPELRLPDLVLDVHRAAEADLVADQDLPVVPERDRAHAATRRQDGVEEDHVRAQALQVIGPLRLEGQGADVVHHQDHVAAAPPGVAQRLDEDAGHAAVVEDVALAPDARLGRGDGGQHLRVAGVATLQRRHPVARGVGAILLVVLQEGGPLVPPRFQRLLVGVREALAVEDRAYALLDLVPVEPRVLLARLAPPPAVVVLVSHPAIQARVPRHPYICAALKGRRRNVEQS